MLESSLWTWPLWYFQHLCYHSFEGGGGVSDEVKEKSWREIIQILLALLQAEMSENQLERLALNHRLHKGNWANPLWHHPWVSEKWFWGPFFGALWDTILAGADSTPVNPEMGGKGWSEHDWQLVGTHDLISVTKLAFKLRLAHADLWWTHVTLDPFWLSL